MNQEVDKNLFRFAGRELAGGGDRTPLEEFIGKLEAWDVVKSNFGDGLHNIVFKFSDVEVIRVREGSGPYPFDHAEVAVKHSGSERSGFGLLVSSMDKSLGTGKQQSDLDLYVGHEWHFHSERFNWGKIPGSTVADDNGDTWGNIWLASLNVASAGANAFVQAPEAPVVEELMSDESEEDLTAEGLLFKLLDGKTQSEWIPEVVQNSVIQQDISLFGSVMNNQWLASQVAAGKVTKDDQDRYHVS
tara:strand:+ start:10531 stop:11265 length:735 start_codon:yes stop_codon:yes gene_type:complete